MQGLINKYLQKLTQQGFSKPKETIFVACDDKPYSNKRLSKDVISIINKMNINSLIISKPISPYKEIVKHIVKENDSVVIPKDCETRTFLHDIPVIDKTDPESVVQALSKRKSALSKDTKIISYGMISPEQAYVNISSTFFSLFIKYFVDMISSRQKIPLNIRKHLKTIQPIRLKEDSIFETGRALVSLRLVDSYFGNISFLKDGAIHISQTGSSLDELEDNIDIIPLDMSSTTGITASSEFSTHRAIYSNTDFKYIVHGHPPFTVIQSMLCDEKDCLRGDKCYQSCKKERYFAGIPIVCGEIGTGATALLNTVPNAMSKSNAVIVFGHGIFVSSEKGFQQCLDEIIRVENEAISGFLDTSTTHV